jgi:uncharacterized membrane protein
MRGAPDAAPQRDTSRIEAFSDGVFAIAITLLILEVKVPAPPQPGQPFSLLSGLLSLWPSYFAYVLSFVTIGIYWARHHYIFVFYTKVDHPFILLNLLFLFSISFLPFPTDVLAQYIRDSANQRVATIFYTIGLFGPSFSWTLMWLYASHGYRLIDRRLGPGFVHQVTAQHIGSAILNLVGILASFVNFKWGLGASIGLTLLYLLPPRTPVYLNKPR